MVFGSAFDSTRAARSSVPSASATPAARPPSTRIRSTGASVRISAPASRAASAIASVSLPDPAADEAPLADPAAGRLGGVVVEEHEGGPGVDGPPVESLIACQPSAARTCSEAKYSDRYWFAEVPNM